MNLKPTFGLLALLFCISACQKEPTFEKTQPTAPNTTTDILETPDGNRLSRTVFRYSADDSTYTDYFYDAAGRWAGLQTTGDGASYTDMQQLHLTRDANGIITSAAFVKFDETTGDEIISEYLLTYDATTKRYTAKTAIIEWNGSEAMDSTVFEYDAAGRIGQTRLFIKADPLEPFAEWARVAYAYDAAGNLASYRNYARNVLDSTQFDAIGEISFTYDDKKNPMNFGAEALLFEQIFFASPANMATVSYKDLTNNEPAEELLQFSYKYHASDKPKSGTLKSDEQDIAVYFRYQ